jgi:hypothetical protein
VPFLALRRLLIDIVQNPSPLLQLRLEFFGDGLVGCPLVFFAELAVAIGEGFVGGDC